MILTRMPFLWLPSLLAVGSTGAFAQSFNIDVGDVAQGQPSSAYGAAANQPGHWNAVDGGSSGVLFDVDDLSGAATSITVSYQRIGNGSGNFHFDAPATTGEDELLMDDLMDIGSGTSIAVWTFSNLQPGVVYDIYTYAWAPDNPFTYKSSVNVSLSGTPAQVLGGKTWPGQQQLGLTVARHGVVVPANGSVQVTVTPDLGYASINGLQFVEWTSCQKPAVYCTAKANSLGCASKLSYAGVPSPTDGSGFELSYQPVAGNTLGLVIYTTQGILVSPNQNPFGWLCIQPAGTFRLPPQLSGGTTQQTCDGRFAVDFNDYFTTATNDPNLVPGAQIDAQFWYRDPPNPGGANLSNAIQFVMCP